jgi:hypothetical protein
MLSEPHLKGTGWVPERPATRLLGKVGTGARALAIGMLLAPESGGSEREPWITDQELWEACTGHGGAQLYYELTGEKVSPWMLWQFGLVREGYDPYAGLPNKGVRVSAMLSSFRKHGACLESEWNLKTKNFDISSIPPGVLRIKAQKRNLDVTPCYATGARLVSLIVDALERKRAVGIGIKVDRRYDRAGSDPIGPVDGETRGLHFITLRRFERRNGAYVFDSASSWSVDHGDNGIVRFTQERVGQSVFACFAKGVS